MPVIVLQTCEKFWHIRQNIAWSALHARKKSLTNDCKQYNAERKKYDGKRKLSNRLFHAETGFRQYYAQYKQKKWKIKSSSTESSYLCMTTVVFWFCDVFQSKFSITVSMPTTHRTVFMSNPAVFDHRPISIQLRISNKREKHKRRSPGIFLIFTDD
jgi:hypothetical protein